MNLEKPGLYITVAQTFDDKKEKYIPCISNYSSDISFFLVEFRNQLHILLFPYKQCPKERNNNKMQNIYSILFGDKPTRNLLKALTCDKSEIKILSSGNIYFVPSSVLEIKKSFLHIKYHSTDISGYEKKDIAENIKNELAKSLILFLKDNNIIMTRPDMLKITDGRYTEDSTPAKILYTTGYSSFLCDYNSTYTVQWNHSEK